MFKSRLLSLLFTIIPFLGFSQPFDDSCVVGGQCAPIDDYLILLFFAAMALGAWYVYKVKQQRVSE